MMMMILCADQNVELLDNDSERLSHLLRWRELEGVFWKWMDSVVDAKQAAAGRGDGASDGSDNVLAEYGATRLIESHQSLQQVILKYESIVEHLERVCEEKVGHDPLLETHKHPFLLSSIQGRQLLNCLALRPPIRPSALLLIGPD